NVLIPVEIVIVIFVFAKEVVSIAFSLSSTDSFSRFSLLSEHAVNKTTNNNDNFFIISKILNLFNYLHNRLIKLNCWLLLKPRSFNFRSFLKFYAISQFWENKKN